MRFSFTGKVDANDLSAKVPFYKKIEGKNSGHSLNLIVIAAKNNRAFCEVAGFVNDPIKTFDTDNNKIDVSWDDRLDEETIKGVAGFRKHVISYGDTRKEFITEYDFVEYVKEHIDEIKGKRFTITGQCSPNEYKGKISDRFRMQSIYEVTDEEKKNDLRVTGEFFYNKDSIDAADWSKEHKLYLNGWTSEYLDKDHPSVYLSKQLIFDCSKLNFEDEKHMKILAFRLKQLGLALDESGKVVSKLKKSKYYKIAVICKYQNGAEETEFSEADLTENQKLALELGLNKLDDFRPAGSIFGNRVSIFKLTSFDLRGDYSDGYVEADFDEDQIYVPIENESTDVLEGNMNPPEENDDNDDGDLFG